MAPDQRRHGLLPARRAKTFCEDGNVAMFDSLGLMAGLTRLENTCFPTGRQGLLELPI